MDYINSNKLIYPYNKVTECLFVCLYCLLASKLEVFKSFNYKFILQKGWFCLSSLGMYRNLSSYFLSFKISKITTIFSALQKICLLWTDIHGFFFSWWWIPFWILVLGEILNIIRIFWVQFLSWQATPLIFIVAFLLFLAPLGGSNPAGPIA